MYSFKIHNLQFTITLANIEKYFFKIQKICLNLAFILSRFVENHSKPFKNNASSLRKHQR